MHCHEAENKAAFQSLLILFLKHVWWCCYPSSLSCIWADRYINTLYCTIVDWQFSLQSVPLFTIAQLTVVL